MSEHQLYGRVKEIKNVLKGTERFIKIQNDLFFSELLSKRYRSISTENEKLKAWLESSKIEELSSRYQIVLQGRHDIKFLLKIEFGKIQEKCFLLYRGAKLEFNMERTVSRRQEDIFDQAGILDDLKSISTFVNNLNDRLENTISLKNHLAKTLLQAFDIEVNESELTADFFGALDYSKYLDQIGNRGEKILAKHIEESLQRIEENNEPPYTHHYTEHEVNESSDLVYSYSRQSEGKLFITGVHKTRYFGTSGAIKEQPDSFPRRRTQKEDEPIITYLEEGTGYPLAGVRYTMDLTQIIDSISFEKWFLAFVGNLDSNNFTIHYTNRYAVVAIGTPHKDFCSMKEDRAIAYQKMCIMKEFLKEIVGSKNCMETLYNADELETHYLVIHNRPSEYESQIINLLDDLKKAGISYGTKMPSELEFD